MTPTPCIRKEYTRIATIWQALIEPEGRLHWQWFVQLLSPPSCGMIFAMSCVNLFSQDNECKLHVSPVVQPLGHQAQQGNTSILGLSTLVAISSGLQSIARLKTSSAGVYLPSRYHWW